MFIFRRKSIPTPQFDVTAMRKAAVVHRVESKRQWASGLAITLTSLVCLFAFWRISPGITFVVAVCALFALVVLFWLAGSER
jgi:hypothetical protein